MFLVHKLSDAIGQGIVSRHIQKLTDEGYLACSLNLALLSDDDISFPNVLTPIQKSIQELQSKSDKIAIVLDEYERSKNQVPKLVDMVRKGSNPFNLREEDIVILQCGDGFVVC